MNKNLLWGTSLPQVVMLQLRWFLWIISILENFDPIDSVQLMYSSDWTQNVKAAP